MSTHISHIATVKMGLFVFKLNISFPIVPDKWDKLKSKSLFNKCWIFYVVKSASSIWVPQCVLLCTWCSPKALASGIFWLPQWQPGDNYNVTHGFRNLKFVSEIIQLAIPHSKKPHNVWTILRLLDLPRLHQWLLMNTLRVAVTSRTNFFRQEIRMNVLLQNKMN